MRELHRTSICLVSSLYFLLKKQQHMGEKPLKRTQTTKTQHKSDDGFCFIFYFKFFYFLANGKKMRCPRHRGLLFLCISHCPPPSGCQRLPQTPGHVCPLPACPPRPCPVMPRPGDGQTAQPRVPRGAARSLGNSLVEAAHPVFLSLRTPGDSLRPRRPG